MLGHTILSGFHPPAKYSNELFGVEYLYSQTGHTFTPDVDAEAETGIEGLSQQDEGFFESSLDTDTCALPSDDNEEDDDEQEEVRIINSIDSVLVSSTSILGATGCCT